MSRRKARTFLEEVLPDDEELGERNYCWRDMFDKYSNMKDTVELGINETLEAMKQNEEEKVIESDVSDVIEDNFDDPQPYFNERDVSKQMSVVLKDREKGWKQNGLFEILEDRNFDMLSDEKVESWLSQHCSNWQNKEYKKGHEVCVIEKDNDKRMKLHRKREILLSKNDEADSLHSVDTTKYILSSNQNLKNYKEVKVKTITTTTIKNFCKAQSNSVLTNPLAITNNRSPDHIPHRKTISVIPEIPKQKIKNRRQKKFRRTKNRRLKSACSSEGSVQWEESSHNASLLKNTSVLQQRKRLSVIETFDSEEDEVFTSPKHKIRELKVQLKKLPVKKLEIIDKSEIEPPEKMHKHNNEHEAPALSPEKENRIPDGSELSISDGNEETPAIVNSPEMRSLQLEAALKKYREQDKHAYETPDPLVGVFVYEPKVIKPNASDSDLILIKEDQLDLSGIKSAEDRLKFKNFAKYIHCNSSIIFYPMVPLDYSTDDEPDPIVFLTARNYFNVMEVMFFKAQQLKKYK